MDSVAGGGVDPSPVEGDVMTPEAQGRVVSAFRGVAVRLPWARDILYALTFVFTEKVKTMAVDERLRLYVNSEFVSGLTPDELEGVLAHEVLHVLLNHHKRMRPPWSTAKNLAADAEDNADLRRIRVVLPEGAVYPETIGGTDNETAEEMLQRLKENACPSLGKRADGLPDKAGVHGPGPWEEDAGADKPGVDPERVQAERLKSLEKALQAPPGTVPGGILREAERVLCPLNWRLLLAGIVGSSVGKARNGWSIRRKHPAIGGKYVLPTLGRAKSPTIAVIGDTSGSMGVKALGQVLDVVLQAAHHARTFFIACDSEASKPREIKSRADVKLEGGGGTDFVPAFRAVEGIRPSPSVTIIVTDTLGDWPEERPRCGRVLCVIPSGIEVRPDRVPDWAKVIKV